MVGRVDNLQKMRIALADISSSGQTFVFLVALIFFSSSCECDTEFLQPASCARALNPHVSKCVSLGWQPQNAFSCPHSPKVVRKCFGDCIPITYLPFRNGPDKSRQPQWA
jgi:hypothetical protein